MLLRDLQLVNIEHILTLNDLHAYYWDYEHHFSAIVTMMHAVDMGRKSDFSLIKKPLLLLYNPSDKVINQNKTISLLENTQSGIYKKLILETEDPYNHVLAGEAISPSSVDTAVDAIYTFTNEIIEAQ